MRSFKLYFLIFGILAAGSVVFAQYPTITPEVAAQEAELLQKTKAASDAAWEKALPIVEKEALEGRPYLPFASRPTDLPKADIPAFPGAEGGAKFSFGGRGGKVIVVTNLNDSGPGSFREACEQGGARIVVFNVAGIIRLTTPVVIRAPYITIAGQTAPGDGVCIAGESVWMDTHDVVIRHMRFRRGETWVGRRDDALGGDPVGNVIIDHVSASWGLDENLSIYRRMYESEGVRRRYSTVNITIQNSISSQALDTYAHSFGSTLGGVNSTFMRNLYANNAGRNPSVGASGAFNFINNVVYNWDHRTGDGGDSRSRYNFFNNYYKPGPLTPKDTPAGRRILKPESRTESFGQVYAHGNIMEGYPEITADNWAGGIQVLEQFDTEGYTEKIKVDSPFPILYPFPVMTAQEAYDFVLENAGATLPKRDLVDERTIEQIRTGKVHYDPSVKPEEFYQFESRRLPADSYKQGIITDIRQVGGYPEYKGTPYKDSDSDGMPDEWEIKYGLNPNDPSDAVLDMNGDGYTNIEKYINGMDPTQKVDWTHPENNRDPLIDKKSLF